MPETTCTCGHEVAYHRAACPAATDPQGRATAGELRARLEGLQGRARQGERSVDLAVALRRLAGAIEFSANLDVSEDLAATAVACRQLARRVDPEFR